MSWPKKQRLADDLEFIERDAALKAFHPGPGADFVFTPGPPEWLRELRDPRRLS